MNRSEYKQMLTLKYFYEEKLQEIKKKHKSDPDLCHPIGKDRYCLYCEKYQEIQDKLQPMVKQLMEYEKTHEVKQPVIQQLAAVPKKEKAKPKKCIKSILSCSKMVQNTWFIPSPRKLVVDY